MIKADIVGDSISPQGHRLTSFVIVLPRIVLAELNTHRMLSKNSASSRAIPFKKMVEIVQNNPFIPIAWQKDHKGMQGNEYFTKEDDIQGAIDEWLESRDGQIANAKQLNKQGVTKQLCNRLLEPFMWHTVLITGEETGLENFFALRCPKYRLTTNGEPVYFRSKKDAIKYVGKDFAVGLRDDHWREWNEGQAEIHIMALAEAMWDAYNESIPEQLEEGDWHIPFEDKISLQDWYNNNKRPTAAFWNELEGYEMDNYKVKIATAMAARTSYTTVGDEKEISYEKLIELHDKLITQDPLHASPMEHCARAMTDDEYSEFIRGRFHEVYDADHVQDDAVALSCSTDPINLGWCRNFRGFIQYRHILENK